MEDQVEASTFPVLNLYMRCRDLALHMAVDVEGEGVEEGCGL